MWAVGLLLDRSWQPECLQTGETSSQDLAGVVRVQVGRKQFDSEREIIGVKGRGSGEVVAEDAVEHPGDQRPRAHGQG
jgi:hypothetical protein